MILNTRLENLLLRLNPSEMALMDWLNPRIDDSHLEEIAMADHGMNREPYFQALKRIHEGYAIPVPLGWTPGEALKLYSYSEPDDPDHISPPPNSKGTRGHLIRAFCCTVLLQATKEPESRMADYETLHQLIRSTLHLGREASKSTERFLCWRILRLPPDYYGSSFFALALLVLHAALFESQADLADLSVLAEWFAAEEEQARTNHRAIPRSVIGQFQGLEGYMLGLSCWEFSAWHRVWRKLAEEILLDPAKPFPDPVAITLRAIVERLVPEIEILEAN